MNNIIFVVRMSLEWLILNITLKPPVLFGILKIREKNLEKKSLGCYQGSREKLDRNVILYCQSCLLAMIHSSPICFIKKQKKLVKLVLLNHSFMKIKLRYWKAPFINLGLRPPNQRSTGEKQTYPQSNWFLYFLKTKDFFKAYYNSFCLLNDF